MGGITGLLAEGRRPGLAAALVFFVLNRQKSEPIPVVAAERAEPEAAAAREIRQGDISLISLVPTMLARFSISSDDR